VDSGNGFGTRVFWTAVIPDSDVQVNPGAGRAEMHVRDLPELDYYSPSGQGDLASLGPTWQTGYFASTVSFDVVWGGPVTRRVQVKDAANGFAGQFDENQATVTWSVNSTSGFRFTSNPGNFSTSVPEIPGVNGVTVPLNFFAEIGQERNGVFFPSGSSDGLPAGSAVARTGQERAHSLASNPTATVMMQPLNGGDRGGGPLRMGGESSSEALSRRPRVGHRSRNPGLVRTEGGIRGHERPLAHWVAWAADRAASRDFKTLVPDLEVKIHRN
jgi:hypothetical protein